MSGDRWISVKEAATRAGFGSVAHFRRTHCDPECPSFLIRVFATPGGRIRAEVEQGSLDAWLDSLKRRPGGQ
jgi:AraC-like DNA-binding protein